MKKLIALICRHGETKLNADNRFRSWLDIHLDPKGEKQAEDMANVLVKYPVTSIYASPLYRTVHTASIFANKVDLPINQNRGLFPWNLGVLAGTDKKENAQLLNVLVDNPDVRIPNGESLREFEERVAKFYNDVIFNHTKGLSVIFCHTSNIIVLEGLLDGQHHGPESVELVKPGGICAVYKTDDWFSIEPIFRKSNDLEV